MTKPTAKAKTATVKKTSSKPTCPQCAKVLKMSKMNRTKRFCDDLCRCRYHNAQRREALKFMRSSKEADKTAAAA